MSNASARFELLASPILGDLYRFARRLAGPSDAEDLVQAALERGLERLHTLKDERAFRAWQFRVLFNAWRDRAAKIREFPIEHVDEVPAGGGPDQRVLAVEIGDRVHAALDRLPREQSDAVWLVDGLGFTFGEAAEVLGAPIGTVASRVARGRQALRITLGDVAAEQGVA